MKALATTAGLLAIAFIVTGCSRETPLPGERIDVRNAAISGGTVEGGEISGTVSSNTPFATPRAINHNAWTHRGGSAVHRASHPSLRGTLTPVWSANIGAGDTRKTRITSDPVVAGGRIFTIDSQSRVVAHSTSGAPLWSRDLVPSSDNRKDASGGGLAIGDGKLFVTTGFGELLALNPASGATIWRQGFDAPVSGAPTYRGGLVYVSSRDNRGFAINASNGRLTWEVQAAPSASATVNGAGPAVTDRIAVFPFSSTQLIAALRKSGIQTWTSSVAGNRLGRAFAGVTDIAGDPVVVGNTVYVGSPSGRIAAININDGERIWTATEGAMSPVIVEGGSVFAVNDIQQLVRLDAATGQVIWKTALPNFKAKRARRLRDVYAHYGPVLAGGRLIVASDDGGLRSFDPRNGQLISGVQLPDGGATTNPVVVNGTLYLVTTNGTLVAFR